jgi:N-glycosylase/DNA lyase
LPLLHWQTYPEKNNIDFIKNYLRLDVNYPRIIKKIQKDKHIKSAIKKYPDLRLLKQDFEETLLSFLVSSNNNIRSIRKIIRSMNKKFGRAIKIDGREIFLFPKTEVIAEAKLEDLLECKLGFRAKYLKGAAKYLLENDLSKKIEKMSETDVRKTLLGIHGVGEKITDCVLVFGLGFDNVTPLDVWGKRVFTKFYKLSPKMKYEDMRFWASNYFEGYAGWAGQFLYEYIRTL